MTSSVVTGCAAYLPERIMPNSELEAMVETSDAWIRERTGIAQRHIAAEGETTSDMATQAAKRALEKAGVSADEIDTIIVATSTPDKTMPSTATLVQQKLGNHGAAAFDVAAACSGFVYGMSIAHGLIASGQSKKLLVIGAETMSRIIDWEDRGTCILFGDGAGAVVVEAQDNTDRGVKYCRMQADGAHADILNTTGGVSSTQEAGTLFMSGREVFRHGVEKMANAVIAGAEQAGIALEDIDYVVPHQANIRIINSIAQKLGLREDQGIVTVDKHANTSAASIPLALAHACDEGLIKQGKILAMPALGAGLTWGCCIIKW